MNHKITAFLILVTLCPLNLLAQNSAKDTQIERITVNTEAEGTNLEITFRPGRGHNHPSFAIWLEAPDGQYIETLFVTAYVATGVFRFGSIESGKWEPAPVQRKAALPYWGHKRGVINEFGNFIPSVKAPLPDAITGPTPKGAFVLHARSGRILQGDFRVLIEINQTWDWNPFWHNNKFPEDAEYRTSAQPAVVYAADFKAGEYDKSAEFRPIGRSHHSGASGELYTDLHTLTTAMEIAGLITVKIREK